MSHDLEFRTPRADEAEPLARLGRETFIETFGHQYRPEDLRAFLNEQYAQEAIASEIADPQITLRVLAGGGGLIGFIKLGPLKLPVTNPPKNSHEIRQLYLRQDFTGRGLGERFLTWALAHLEKQHIARLYLSVFSENHGALRFYRRFGFQKCGEYLYPVGQQQDLEFIFFRNLTETPRKMTGPE